MNEKDKTEKEIIVDADYEIIPDTNPEDSEDHMVDSYPHTYPL